MTSRPTLVGSEAARPLEARWRRTIIGGAGIVILIVLAIGSAAPAAAAPPLSGSMPAAGVLDLPDDGFLTGRLAPVPANPGQARTTLLWQSPLFAEPIEFALAGINRVRFPKATAPGVPADAWRAELTGDDVLVGRLESIDADHVVLDVPGVNAAPLRLRRGQVTRLTRMTTKEAGLEVILPGPFTGWDADRSAWRDVAGRLACRTSGRPAFRDTRAPARACFDMLLSWDERPDLEICLAARRADADTYRLEALAGELIAIREGKTAAVERVATLPAGAGSVRILVFLDQERGRMAVLIPDADGTMKVGFDHVVPPVKPKGRGGFSIGLSSGDVRIDRLLVSPWEDPEPQLSRPADLGGPGAEIESFDKATASFTFRAAAGPRQVAATAVSEIVLAAPGVNQPPVPGGMLLAAFHGGCRLTGRLLEVTPESIRFDFPAVVDPVVCRLDSLAALESVGERQVERLPGPAGTLEADEARLAGCFADAAVPGTGITWLPLGGVRPVAIADTARGARFILEMPAAAAGQGQPAARVRAGPAVLFLKTGDSLGCEVLAAGPEGLRIKAAAMPEMLVPTAVLRAVELLPAASARVSKTTNDRLLTLPRSQQSDPPTHLLRLTRGDYLRGKLISMDNLSVVMEVAGVAKQLPRSAVARLIWLSIEGDDSDAVALAAMAAGEAGDGVPLRVMLKDGRRLTMRATGLEGSRLVGVNGLLGRVGVDLGECGRIDLWPSADTTPAKDLPFSQWKLRPAALPRALRDDPAPASPAEPPPAPGRPDRPLTARETKELQDLAAAREAALAEDRGCLALLGKLLDAESEEARRQSIALLRRMTGLSQEALPYQPGAGAAEREESVRRWRQWLAANGLSAELSFPRAAVGKWADAPPLTGRTLICGPGQVRELDEQGDVVFEAPANSPWACDVTPEQHRLIGDHAIRTLIEYDEQGVEVWAVRDLPGGPMSARRLENGNTLVALSDANLVAEYDPKGKIAWSVKVAGRPCDARRLPDGNTLVAAHRANRIVELDADGKEVWVVEAIDDPQTAQRLPDGNTLVAMSVPGIVREIDRDGRTIWERQGFKIPVDVQRLPDGTTLVQEQGGDLIELDAGGTEIERRTTGGSRFLRW
jgi:hypothetical protein